MLCCLTKHTQLLNKTCSSNVVNLLHTFTCAWYTHCHYQINFAGRSVQAKVGSNPISVVFWPFLFSLANIKKLTIGYLYSITIYPVCTLLMRMWYFSAGKNDCQLSCLNENNNRLVTSIASGTPCRTFTGQRGVCLETLCTVSLSSIKLLIRANYAGIPQYYCCHGAVIQCQPGGGKL